ncbi:hypothetical protein M758_UG321700 [Ceratodon purpureus]|nr:hypothetical protein M758_UG321700 [Ceratodon purpureus]
MLFLCNDICFAFRFFIWRLCLRTDDIDCCDIDPRNYARVFTCGHAQFFSF